MASAAAVLERNGLALMVRAHPDNIYVLTLEGIFLEFNDNVPLLTGYSKDELRAMSFGPILHPDYAEMTWQNFERASAGETVNYVTTCVSKSGDEFVIDVTNLPLQDDDGTIVAVMGIARDIGATRGLQERVERDEVARRIAGKLAKFGGWSIEVPSVELFWSDELFGMLKVDPGGTPPFDYAINMYPAPYRQEVERELEACVTEGTPIDLESVIRDARGREFPVHIVGEAVRDDAGTIIRVQGAFQDITDLVADRDERLSLQTRLSSTLSQITDGIYFIDRQWRFTFVNETGERYVGSSSDVLLGGVLWELFPEAWDTTFGIAYREVMEKRVTRTVRDYYPPFGAWFEATVYPTDDGVAVYLRDVSADEQIRAELRAQTARLAEQAELLDSARDAIIVCSLDYTVTYWNRGAERMYGWETREALGRSLDVLLSMDPAEAEGASRTARRKGHWLGELRQHSRDGREIIADCRWQFVCDDSGEPGAIFAIHSDVTAARIKQNSLIRAQRLESLGTLAGGIAHDLNNALTPILMSGQLLDNLERDAGKRELLKGIETGVKRGADMIRQVLSFAQGVEGERRPVIITDLLVELMAFCRNTLPVSIDVTLETDRKGELWMVEGDSTQLLQVLVNLVTNARDAVGTAGTITIRAHNRALPDDGITVEQAVSDGDYVVIEVEDDGGGMPEEVASRVFEPFFTTKETGSGTGLGLPTSLSIAQNHGGHLQLYTEPGAGSRFQVLLPRASCPDAAAQSPAASLPRGSGQRILVIDDEAAIRRIVCATLAAHGYETSTASNGREGIDLLESLEVPVDLVLTDMQMPVMDGASTAAYLAEHHPSVAVVAASGLTANGGVVRDSHPGVHLFIPKPFTSEALLTTIARALGSAQADAVDDDERHPGSI